MAPSVKALFAFSALASFALDRSCPEYVIHRSRILTASCIFVVSLLGLFIYSVYLYPRYFTPFKNLPQVNLVGRFMQRHNIESVIVKSVNSGEHGEQGLLRLYAPHALETILVRGTEALADITVRRTYHFEKPKHIKADLSKIFAKGLFTAEGVEHKLLRKKLAPAFMHGHIRSLYPLFWSKSLEMASAMEQQVYSTPDSKGVVSLLDWAFRATLDILGVGGMGVDFKSIGDPENSIYADYMAITDYNQRPQPLLVLARAFGFETLFQLGLKIPTQKKRNRDAAADNIRNMAKEMVVNQKMRGAHVGEADSENIVSVIMQGGEFSNEEDLVDEIMTFIGAGHETTSVALQWAIYSLCRHQDVQRRLRKEVRDCLDADADSVDGAAVKETSAAEKLHRLPYLNAFVNEVLRFWPPVPVTLRRAVCDTTVDGTAIPRDTVLIIPIRAINHNKLLWGATADQFEPERWLQPGQANLGGAAINYANMTFLHGPHSCIGREFSRSELLFLVAALASRFEIDLEKPGVDIDWALYIIMAPKDELRVRLTPVESKL